MQKTLAALIKRTLALSVWSMFVAILPMQAQEDPAFKVTKIWDQALHNAFTDLIRYKGTFYCVFRESTGHVPKDHHGDGKIRVLSSNNGAHWQSFALLEKDGYDLRDPSLSVAADGRLMVLMGGSIYDHGRLTGRANQVAFLDPASRHFSAPMPVQFDKSVPQGSNWLWRIAWHQGKAYGMIYQADDQDLSIHLVRSDDGIHYALVHSFKVTGRPNETAMQFAGNGDLYIMVRREEAGSDGLLGKSAYPYQDWEWASTGHKLGGPHFIWTPDGALVAGTRCFPEGGGARTGLLVPDSAGQFRTLLLFPSGGDTSYPGMWIWNGYLYVTYYSSHEGKAAIYLAKIRLKDLRRAIGAHGTPHFGAEVPSAGGS